MARVEISYPGNRIVSEFTALVSQPTVPSGAPVPDIGLVEITSKGIPGPVGPPGPGVVVSDTPPANPKDGTLWLESDTGVLWAWFVDPDSAQWVQISGGTGSKSSVIISDTPPAGAENGQMWWNSTTGNLYCWFVDADSAQYVQVNTSGSVISSSGTGAPNGVVTASVGALYTRLDGGAGSTLYVKESGSGSNTGWVAK